MLKKIERKKWIFKKHRLVSSGYALYIAMLLTSLMFLVAYYTLSLTLRQFSISNIGAQSHIAFYNADSGIECAIYHDLKNGPVSAFDVNVSGSINCNNQTVVTGSQTVSTNPPVLSRIGGGGSSNIKSIFQINFTTGCAIVEVTKNSNNTTTIESRGYNNCGSGKRFERAQRFSY